MFVSLLLTDLQTITKGLIFEKLSLVTPELFAKTAFFGQFGDFQAGYGPNYLQSTQKGICKMTACLSYH